MTSGGEWVARLLVAFGGDLSGWAWTGEVREDPECRGTCACSHTGLRYLFPWRKPGEGEVITGSICVYNLPGISIEQVARVRAEVDRREEAERKQAAIMRQAQRTEDAAEIAKVIRGLWPRVYELEARLQGGGSLSPAQGRLLARQNDLHEAFREAIRLRTPAGRVRRLVAVQREILQGLDGPIVEGAL